MRSIEILRVRNCIYVTVISYFYLELLSKYVSLKILGLKLIKLDCIIREVQIRRYHWIFVTYFLFWYLMNSILHLMTLNSVKLPKTLTEIKSRFWHHIHWILQSWWKVNLWSVFTFLFNLSLIIVKVFRAYN